MFCNVSVFSVHSFIPVFAGVLVSYLFLLTSFPPINIRLSLLLFSLCFLLSFSSLLLYAFPIVSSCFSRDYQTCTSQCSANHAFFSSFHDLSRHSFGRTYYGKYMQYHWLIHETSNSTRGALRGKSYTELFQTLVCRFSFEKEITVCGLKQKLVWFHCDLSICQSGWVNCLKCVSTLLQLSLNSG
jgi:hypothetical protein